MVYTGALQRDYERLNMMTLQEFLEKQFDENLMLAVLSGQRSKEKEAPSKVRIRQIELKGSVCYQASSTVGTKVLHSNYSREEVIAYVEQSLQEGGFSQLQVQGRCKDGSVLVSKKGKVTVKVKEHQAKEPVQILAHNRVKQYILKEGTPVPFLVDLGSIVRLMTSSNRSTVSWSLLRIFFRHCPGSGRSRSWILDVANHI